MRNQTIGQNSGLMLLWSFLPFGKSKGNQHHRGDLDSGTRGQFILYDNYPNPFRTITIIYFALMNASQVRIDIEDESGKKILTLINEKFEPGVQRVPLYRINNDVSLTPGSYRYRLTVSNDKGRFSQDKSLTLL